MPHPSQHREPDDAVDARLAVPALGEPTIEQRLQRRDDTLRAKVPQELGMCSVTDTDDGEASRVPRGDAGGAVSESDSLFRADA